MNMQRKIMGSDPAELHLGRACAPEDLLFTPWFYVHVPPWKWRVYMSPPVVRKQDHWPEGCKPHRRLLSSFASFLCKTEARAALGSAYLTGERCEFQRLERGKVSFVSAAAEPRLHGMLLNRRRWCNVPRKGPW